MTHQIRMVGLGDPTPTSHRTHTLATRALLLALVLGGAAAELEAQTIGLNVGDSARVLVAPSAKLTLPVSVDLTSAGALNIASLQAGLTWGASRLTFDSIRVVPSTGFSLTPNTANAASGSVTFNTFSATALAASGTLLNVFFTAGATTGGTRVALTPTVAGNDVGQDVLSHLAVRNTDVCVATRGLWGDVTDDGTVNIVDAQQIARYSVGLSVANPTALLARGDVMADGSVNIIDAQQIARFTVALSTAARVNTQWVSAAPVTTVAVTPSGDTLQVGQTAGLSAALQDSTAASVTGCYAVTWQSSDPSLATVSSTGVVAAVAAGAVTITATSEGKSGSAEMLIAPAPPLVQQGPKLVATNALGNSGQGQSVSISADGNTAIVGGPTDNGGVGAAWVWTRIGGAWSQGPKLVGSGAYAPIPGWPDQGCSVSLASDGNTALVGGCRSGAWVWTRSGGVWTQQGAELVPSTPCGPCQSMGAATLSADGNTAILAGRYDDVNPGVVVGAWVWTRSGGVWTPQGPMLVVGSGVAGGAGSVALSADGSTAIIGTAADSSFVGAAWVWTRIAGTWSQQGPKLVGTGAVGGTNGGNGTALQGSSVALSADGNTAVVGGPADGCCPSINDGAVWVWTRSAGVWTQQGSKLVGPGGVNSATVQGMSVSLSADGNTALVGGVSGIGETSTGLYWTRSGGVWTVQGSILVGSGAVGYNGQQPGVSVSLSADGNNAIIGGWYDDNGAGAAWAFTKPVVAVSSAAAKPPVRSGAAPTPRP